MLIDHLQPRAVQGYAKWLCSLLTNGLGLFIKQAVDNPACNNLYHPLLIYYRALTGRQVQQAGAAGRCNHSGKDRCYQCHTLTTTYMYHALQDTEKFSSISTKKDIQKQSMKQLSAVITSLP